MEEDSRDELRTEYDALKAQLTRLEVDDDALDEIAAKILEFDDDAIRAEIERRRAVHRLHKRMVEIERRLEALRETQNG